MELWQPYGLGKVVRSTAPTNGQPGFAPMCEYVYLVSTSQAKQYLNAGTTTSSLWIENDALAGNVNIFGSTGLASLGTSAPTFLGSGNLYRNILTAANGVNPGATAADKIVDAYTLPASAFDLAGRGIQITLWGTFANNANSKRVKVFYNAGNSAPAVDGSVTVTGGTVIGDSGAITTTGGGGFTLTCQLFKTGAAGSNTQESMTTAIVFGATHSGIGSWTDQTFTESSSALIVVTLNCATTATDLKYQGCEITAFN
jgi:hypothetical protein